jgi:hypothetical protein
VSAFYDRMAATAARLISSKGAPGTLLLTELPTMTAAGDRVDNALVLTVTGVVVGEESTMVEGTERIATKALLAPLSVRPEVGDRLMLGTVNGPLVKANTLAPDGTVLYHEVWT